jgi:hypothetical protein
MGLVISKGLTLKSYNTPAAIAGVAPTLDYRFALDRREIEATSLTDKLTYTGATNGTFVNRAGLIERATTDQPRFDHGPASRQSLGLLVEEQRTNIVLQSQDLATTWAATSASVGTNTTTAPDGTLTADTITASSSTIGRVQQTITFTGDGNKAVSVWLKAGTAPTSIVKIDDSTAGFVVRLLITVTWTNGVASGSASNGVLQGIDVFPNGWYRIRGLAVGVVAANTNRYRIEADSTNGTGTVIAWGAQAENGAFPTSYIPTTTTALTRPVDSAVIDGTGVITGTYTLVEKPAGCAVVNGTNIDLVSGFTAERVMVFPAALSAPQITAIRGAM